MAVPKTTPEAPEVELESMPFVFGRAPMLIYWEMTRACDLACRHCRAEALPGRNPLELSQAEGREMLRAALGFGQPLPHFVFTGGDPFKRPDLFRLVEEARLLGFNVSLAPSGTPLITQEKIRRLAEIGVGGMSLSLDGASAAQHDAFRGVPGCFDTTLKVARWIREAALPLQINTLVTAETVGALPGLARLLPALGIERWSLFFLISVGRGKTGLTEITPGQTERLFLWLYQLSRRVQFQIKTTEAMHYRRVAVKQMTKQGMDQAAMLRSPAGRGFGIRDGNGVMFVSHTGEVYPSGFLPLPTGNVKDETIVDLYRDSPVFRQLRDTQAFGGKCHDCEFVHLCGGSRARAYAATGNYLAPDPLCPYQPRVAQPGGARAHPGVGPYPAEVKPG